MTLIISTQRHLNDMVAVCLNALDTVTDKIWQLKLKVRASSELKTKVLKVEFKKEANRAL